MKHFFKIAIIGIGAGIISGLFTSGGGLILVPAFVYLLNVDEIKARGTAIVCILSMVLTSSIFYYKGNFMNWEMGFLCAIGGIVGGIIGAKLLKKMPKVYIKILFTIFLLYVGIKMLIIN